VTDASEFVGTDIVALFREEGGEVIADVRGDKGVIIFVVTTNNHSKPYTGTFLD
jgi:hypothetical protein